MSVALESDNAWRGTTAKRLSFVCVVGFSLLVLGAVILFMRWPYAQGIFGYLLLLTFPVVGFWAGLRFYAWALPKEPETLSVFPNRNRRRHWGPIIASIVIGVSVTMFLHSLFTHRMVRSIDDIMALHSDE